MNNQQPSRAAGIIVVMTKNAVDYAEKFCRSLYCISNLRWMSKEVVDSGQ